MAKHEGNYFTPREKEFLNQLVLEIEIHRFSNDEALAYIEARLHKRITERTLSNYKSRLGDQAYDTINRLAKHKTAYIEQFIRRIQEIEKYQKHLWQYMISRPTDIDLQKYGITELHKLTCTLYNLYEMVPSYTQKVISNSIKDGENRSTETEEEDIRQSNEFDPQAKF